jgi:hypothetical protein
VPADLLTKGNSRYYVSIVDDKYAMLRNRGNEVVVRVSVSSRCPEDCCGQSRRENAKTPRHGAYRLSSMRAGWPSFGWFTMSANIIQLHRRHATDVSGYPNA